MDWRWGWQWCWWAAWVQQSQRSFKSPAAAALQRQPCSGSPLPHLSAVLSHASPPLLPARPLPQTLVFKLGLAKSIHHARVLIRQRHIRVGKQIVNIPSFMVRVDSQVRAWALLGSRCSCSKCRCQPASRWLGLSSNGQWGSTHSSGWLKLARFAADAHAATSC